MSMEFATEERGKLLKSEPEQEQKSERELKQKLKTKPDGDLVKRDFSKYDDSIHPYIYKSVDFVYKNEAWKKGEAEFLDFKKRSRGLSPYDAIAPPVFSHRIFSLAGGIRPLPIHDDNRSTLIALCELALEDYNQQRIQAPTFVFHQLVKCCFARDGFSGYYITFQAKEKTEEEEEDPSNSPAAITTFQAQLWETENETHEVKECKIKI